MNKLIDLSVFMPWGFLMHLIRSIFTFNIVHSLLKDKYKSIYTFAAIVSVTTVFTWITLKLTTNVISEIVSAVIYYALIFIILVLLTQGKAFKKIIAMVISIMAWTFSNLMLDLFLNIINGSNNTYGASFKVPIYYFLTNLIVLFVFSFIVVAIINLIKYKTKKDLNYDIKYIWYFLIPLSHAFVFIIYYLTLQSVGEKNMIIIGKQHPHLLNTVLAVFAFFLIFDCLLIFIIDKQSARDKKTSEYEKQIIINDMDFNQMQMLKEEKLEFRKLKHDMANILVTSKGFIEIEKPEKALELINNATDNLSKISAFSLCSNDTINTVLSMKTDSCKEYGIDLKAIIDETYTTCIDDYDLCRILTNIIDNSVNALSCVEGEKTAYINIIINKENLIIESKNKFSDTEKQKHILGNTGKHGYGTSIIKSIAKKYKGAYTHSVDGEYYLTKTIIENKSVEEKQAIKA